MRITPKIDPNKGGFSENISNLNKLVKRLIKKERDVTDCQIRSRGVIALDVMNNKVIT